MLLGATYYFESDNEKDADAKLECIRLEFEPNEIRYIVIDNESEISDVIDHLRRAKSKHYSLHDIERLTTRRLTTEQIRSAV